MFFLSVVLRRNLPMGPYSLFVPLSVVPPSFPDPDFEYGPGFRKAPDLHRTGSRPVIGGQREVRSAGLSIPPRAPPPLSNGPRRSRRRASPVSLTARGTGPSRRGLMAVRRRHGPCFPDNGRERARTQSMFRFVRGPLVRRKPPPPGWDGGLTWGGRSEDRPACVRGLRA